MIRVAVVDDHPLFRDGVTQTLRTAADIDVIGEGASADDAVRIGCELGPDVLILDMNLANGSDGITALVDIATQAPAVRVLVLTVVADIERMRDAIERRAGGYVLKGIGGAELINAVRTVHGGEGYVTSTLAARLFSRSDRAGAAAPAGAASTPLSAREEQILAFIAHGLSNKEIGLRLALSEKTVKHYVTNLFQKMQVRNRTQAAISAAHLRVDREDAARIGRAESPLDVSRQHTRPI